VVGPTGLGRFVRASHRTVNSISKIYLLIQTSVPSHDGLHGPWISEPINSPPSPCPWWCGGVGGSVPFDHVVAVNNSKLLLELLEFDLVKCLSEAISHLLMFADFLDSDVSCCELYIPLLAALLLHNMVAEMGGG